MRRLVSLVISLALIGVLFTGAAWAKPGGESKGKSKNVVQQIKNEEQSENQIENQAKRQLKDQTNSIKGNKGAVTENKYKDVKGHWAKSTIIEMSELGIFAGYDDGTFRPDDPITELETVSLVDRITEEGIEEEDLDLEEDELGDVPGWAKKSVQKAVYKGAININRFHSHKQCERVDAAVIIAKYMGLTPADTSTLPFKDGILISPEDAGYVLALYNEGIISGTPDGKFNPNSRITRAEMAVIIAKINAETGGQTGDTTDTGDDTVSDTDDDADTDTDTDTDNDTGEED
ncbi:S-layer homology domain-containing protein [Pelotomaculum propionicicum]|uniref:S-layer homology domain-containing protein n=1 Tax=Pelotomaculum propionicicum TaxID=258475 RepID=UPI003B7F7119